MRPLLAALVAVLLLAAPVAGASAPPPGLAGALALVGSTATTVTLHAEQTGGSTVTLLIEHYCYDESGTTEVYGGFQRVRFSGSTDASFNVGPRTYHGRLVTPTHCWALLEFFYSSSRVAILDVQDTLP